MPVAMSGVVKRVGMDRGGCREDKGKFLYYFFITRCDQSPDKYKKTY